MRTTPTMRIAAIAAVAVLGLAACGDDGNDAESPSTDAPSESAEATAETEATADELGTIVDVAIEAGSFTTLVAAVEAAGLVETLSGEGPFTVFAPTDDAFATALDELGITAEELLADTETLTSILTYHVVAGAVDAATAISLDGQTADTVNGAPISISVVDGSVMINDATVTTPDVMASNGIIHVIDNVLLPPADDEMSEDMSEEMSEDMSEEAAAGTIVDVAVDAGIFTTLVAAADAAGLVETLSSEGPYTVFAPTDEAFVAALQTLGVTAEELLADTETLTSVLLYHVVEGKVDAATAISLDGQTAPTVNGAEIAISVVDGNVMINDATVVTPDVMASNGIIHIIDTVLLPPSN
jgi:transforming growth factor-beta-induced protein